MCRFISYFSNEAIVLDELLEKPTNSLIKQSHAARDGKSGLNADGFGIAWYNFSINQEPGIFKSTQPAWNDTNLKHIATHIKSPCFLAHVRAATVGDVNQNNCHPFVYDQYSLVHNGTIKNFHKYRRKLIDTIDENLFLEIQGNTDSEHFFFLIMHFIKHNHSLEISLQKAIQWILAIQEDKNDIIKLNITITNGNEIIATRFTSDNAAPLSLYYKSYLNGDEIKSLIISSEILDDQDHQWHEVPINSYIHFRKGHKNIQITSI